MSCSPPPLPLWTLELGSSSAQSSYECKRSSSSEAEHGEFGMQGPPPLYSDPYKEKQSGSLPCNWRRALRAPLIAACRLTHQNAHHQLALVLPPPPYLGQSCRSSSASVSFSSSPCHSKPTSPASKLRYLSLVSCLNNQRGLCCCICSCSAPQCCHWPGHEKAAGM